MQNVMVVYTLSEVTMVRTRSELENPVGHLDLFTIPAVLARNGLAVSQVPPFPVQFLMANSKGLLIHRMFRFLGDLKHENLLCNICPSFLQTYRPKLLGFPSYQAHPMQLHPRYSCRVPHQYWTSKAYTRLLCIYLQSARNRDGN